MHTEQTKNENHGIQDYGWLNAECCACAKNFNSSTRTVQDRLEAAWNRLDDILYISDSHSLSNHLTYKSKIIPNHIKYENRNDQISKYR